MKVAQGIKMHFCRSLKKELLIFSSWKMALAVIAQKDTGMALEEWSQHFAFLVGIFSKN